MWHDYARPHLREDHIVLRKLEPADAAERMRWLCGDIWPPKYGLAGFDRVGCWPASAWVLNAIYENDSLPGRLVRDDAHINGYTMREGTSRTGSGLGFAARLEPPWRRVAWADLGCREGFRFQAVSRKYPLQTLIPHHCWADPAVIPTASRPEVCPATGRRWPVNIKPPTEGSLDEESLLALIDILGEHTVPQALRRCAFYYGFAVWLPEGVGVYEGALDKLPAFVVSQDGIPYTPSNFWPADRSWFVYTDYNHSATRVSGSVELIDALSEVDALDVVRCADT